MSSSSLNKALVSHDNGSNDDNARGMRGILVVLNLLITSLNKEPVRAVNKMHISRDKSFRISRIVTAGPVILLIHVQIYGNSVLNYKLIFCFFIIDIPP